MENFESKKEKDNKNKIGLYLNMAISNNSIGNYDKSKIDYTEEAIVTEKTILMVNKNNKILKLNNQEEAIRKEGENILFVVRKKQNFFQLEKELCDNMILSEDNIEGLNYNLWYAINDNNSNDDYYLNENDIIRFGNIKLVITKIKIKGFVSSSIKSDKIKYNIREINLNKKGTKKINFEQIFDADDALSKNNLNFCNICNNNTNNEDNPLIKLCDCPNYNHYECMKKDIKEKMTKLENKKRTSINYFLKFHCNDCKKALPLKFKIKKDQKQYNLFEFDEPNNEDEDYLIFQSLDYLDRYQDYQKSIHIIRLIEDDNIIKIKIGRDGRKNDNDIKLINESSSREHAIIEYNKEKHNLLLKNISKKNDSLVLIKNILVINKNIINLQIGKVSMEAKLIEENEFRDREDITDKIKTKKEYKEEVRKELESCENLNDEWSYDNKTENYFKYEKKE